MIQRERINADAVTPAPGLPTSAADLSAARAAGTRLLAAAAAAINVALSGNSQQFLNAIRQRGGQ